jgi:hypothetical protein
MSDSPSWPSAVVAVFLIGLVGLMFYEAVNHDFVKIWAGAGSIVGVLVGAVPSYFFHQQAAKANERANLTAGALDSERFQTLKQEHRQLFS